MMAPCVSGLWTLAARHVIFQEITARSGKASRGEVSGLSRWHTEQVWVVGKDRSDRFSVGGPNTLSPNDTCKNHFSPAANTQDWFVCR